MEKEKSFLIATEKIYNEYRNRSIIGELSEKNVHAITKEYLCSDKEKQEVKVGSFYADIKIDNRIYEIQTANFNKLRLKLDYFLIDYQVCIVYPFTHKKWLLWEDKETGLVESKRLSPRTGDINGVFKELYKIKSYLNNPNLSLKILLIDLEETRYLDGLGEKKKIKATKINKFPLELYKEIDVTSIDDYLQFIPKGLKEPFTSKDYAKASHVTRSVAQVALNILAFLEIVKKVDVHNREYLYIINR